MLIKMINRHRLGKQASKQRNNFVDVLKGICIMFVVITHLPWSDEQRLKFLFPFWIAMAVPIFMIISGYVYALSYKRNEINQIEDAYLFKSIVGKITRYTIPFIVAFSIEILIKVLKQDFYLYLENPLEILKLFLRGGTGPGSYYYPLMIQLIFVFPVVYFCVKKYMFKGVIICGLINAIYELLQWAYEMNDGTYRLLLFRYFLLIAVGCYIAGDNWRINKIAYLIVTIIGACFIFAVAYLQYEPKIITYWTGTSFIAGFYIIPLAMFMIGKLQNVRFKPLEIVGKASYHIFLTQMVWYSFARGRMSSWNIYWALVISLGICVGIGIIFYMIEMPINKVINRKLSCVNWEGLRIISK